MRTSIGTSRGSPRPRTTRASSTRSSLPRPSGRVRDLDRGRAWPPSAGAGTGQEARVVRARERALPITKELRLRELGRQRRAIDGDEGPAPAAARVNERGHAFLAGARLTLNDDGNVGGHATRRLARAAQGRAAEPPRRDLAEAARGRVRLRDDDADPLATTNDVAPADRPVVDAAAVEEHAVAALEVAYGGDGTVHGELGVTPRDLVALEEGVARRVAADRLTAHEGREGRRRKLPTNVRRAKARRAVIGLGGGARSFRSLTDMSRSLFVATFADRFAQFWQARCFSCVNACQETLHR